MTKQEAIDVITSCDKIIWYRLADDEKEALDMAIEALSAQLDNNSTKVDNENVDLIRRRDAIDALKRLQKDISGDYTDLDPMVMAGCGYIGDCIGEIQDLPSAQPDLIRCKDCRFEDGVWYCNVHFMDVEPNGFCHLAERKER